MTLDRKVGFIDRPVPVACGQCLMCRMQRASDWTVRAMHESQITWQLEGRPSSFITLTYDDEHLPTDYGLQVRDWQTFAKRLRKKRGPFRFLHCGEYGDVGRRPHYHALIFGHDWADDRIEIKRNERNEPIYLSPSLTACWGMGHATVGALTRESCAYVARYAIKKVTGQAADFAYLRERGDHYWWVKPEYITASMRPGLGKRWFDRFKSDVYPSDETIVNGVRVHTPKYYDKLLGAEDEETLKRVKSKRAENAAKAGEALNPDRIRDKEAILRSIQKVRGN